MGGFRLVFLRGGERGGDDSTLTEFGVAEGLLA